MGGGAKKGGLAFLSKKDWHTANRRNIEKVLAAEEAERKKIENERRIKAELDERRRLEEFRKMQEKAGLITHSHAPEINWIYSGGGSTLIDNSQQTAALSDTKNINTSQITSSDDKLKEEYLLGKEVNLQNSLNEKMRQETKAPSILTKKQELSKTEIATIMREDPLMIIAKKEQQNREEILNNPYKMAKLRQTAALLALSSGQEIPENLKKEIQTLSGSSEVKKEKKEKKKEKKEKKEKKIKKEKYNSRYSSSDSEDDYLERKYSHTSKYKDDPSRYDQHLIKKEELTNDRQVLKKEEDKINDSYKSKHDDQNISHERHRKYHSKSRSPSNRRKSHSSHYKKSKSPPGTRYRERSRSRSYNRYTARSRSTTRDKYSSNRSYGRYSKSRSRSPYNRKSSHKHDDRYTKKSSYLPSIETVKNVSKNSQQTSSLSNSSTSTVISTKQSTYNSSSKPKYVAPQHSTFQNLTKEERELKLQEMLQAGQESIELTKQKLQQIDQESAEQVNLSLSEQEALELGMKPKFIHDLNKDLLLNQPTRFNSTDQHIKRYEQDKSNYYRDEDDIDI